MTEMVANLAQLAIQIELLEQELNTHVERRPDVEVLMSQSGVRPPATRLDDRIGQAALTPDMALS